MSNIEKISFGAGSASSRVSYTINNHQPVICSIIGAQPLFYMDYNEDFLDDEYLFDAAELGLLENEISSLKKQVGMLDRFASDFTHGTEEITNIFAQNAISISAEKTDAPQTTLSELLDVLNTSRVAQAYLENAAQFGVTLELTPHVANASYDRNAGIIHINANLALADQVLLAAKELRRHFQHRQGALLNPLHFNPDSAILINRVQEADLISSVIRIAWELQLSGHKEIWERVENSSFADLGRAFTREAFLDFRTINNGQAATATFESWFLSERCRAADKALIRQMLADHNNQVFDIEQEHMSVTPAILAALGEVPFGKNYLAPHTATLMEDPIFTEVRDRSNANFLWFIKFERTFRETEQELQNPLASAAGIRSGANQTTGDSNEENIVTLYEGSEQTPSNTGKPLSSRSDNPQENNNIVYLRSIPGEL